MKNKDKKPYFFNKEKSGFFDKDFKPINSSRFHFSDIIFNNAADNKIYLYEGGSNSNNAVFYLFDFNVNNSKELKEIHLNVFSEDKADFYIVKQYNDDIEEYVINYAKTTPETIEPIIKFPVNEDDENLLNTVSKKSIDTGLFWVYYSDIIQKVKKTNVRKELVNILSELRVNLFNEISKIKGLDSKECYVQALIDRTLFIKFLEDRHIINSYFYGDDIEYKQILKTKSAEKVNQLFTKVHSIFNNYLFDDPEIPSEVLTDGVLHAISNTIEGVRNGQLSLFDLKFDIIPIESISLIYEIFLDKVQRKNGIYYTPTQLTNFITEKTITKKGQIIDPACGSGAFLISAYKRLLQIENKCFETVIDKINYRTKLIKENIFGIEKEETARRLSVFSLYLSILDDLTVEENTNLKSLLEGEENYPLFHENIGENIICSNTFQTNKFDDKKFDFIVGNPPWKKDFDKEDKCAKQYLENHKTDFSGKSELSQLFQHKAKSWEKEDTRYGFVVNTSNYTNEDSNFQDFFYKNYNIENLYEVTDLELFTASEPAIVCIYTANFVADNHLTLNVLKANDFTKLFKKILVLEDDNIKIKQSDLINTNEKKRIPLRNYLVGNIGDNNILEYLESSRFDRFGNYLQKDDRGKYVICQGIKVYSIEELEKVFEVDISKKSIDEIKELRERFYKENTSTEQTRLFRIPLIKPKNISRFIKNNTKIDNFFKDDISNLHKPRNPQFHIGDRILIPNHGDSFKAIFIQKNCTQLYPSADLTVIKLNNTNYYRFTGILNSKLIEYYLKVKFWSRLGKAHSRLNQDAIPLIPIPINNNSNLVKKIEDLSKQFTNNQIALEDKEDEFNELIYNLYGIGIVEKQRINDFFIKDKQKVRKSDLESYADEFCEYLSDFTKQGIKTFHEVYEENNLVKGICIVKIYFGSEKTKYPRASRVGRYLLLELMKNASADNNILSLRERIYGNNTIYIIKDNRKRSWSLTKASEDAIAEINKINKFNAKNNINGK
jgi:type I restriction-modification system DNA methylase subunit